MAATTNDRVLHGPNPFGVRPEHDLLHPVQRDTPHWGETMYFHVWDPEQEVGAFVHVGRWPGDLDLWWAQTIALLPDGHLLVDRSWGRAPDDRGPATGNLSVRCEEPLSRWRLRFDGAGEPTTLDRMAHAPIGAGRARAFRFDLELEAAAPVWDMHGALGFHDLGWATAHHTQGHTARGTLTVEDHTWTILGVAHRDHSSGPRQLQDFGGLHFFVFVFPEAGRVVNGMAHWQRDGQVGHRVVTVQQGGVCTTDHEVTVTGLADLETHEPHRIEVTVGGADGGVYVAHRRHGYTLSIQEPNVNVNGVEPGAEVDPLLITQSTVRVIAPDGQVGFGVVERDYRRSMLPSPEPR